MSGKNVMIDKLNGPLGHVLSVAFLMGSIFISFKVFLIAAAAYFIGVMLYSLKMDSTPAFLSLSGVVIHRREKPFLFWLSIVSSFAFAVGFIGLLFYY